MAMESGKILRETVISVNGCKTWHMATAYMSGKTVIGMRVSGETHLDMAKDLIFLQMAIYT